MCFLRTAAVTATLAALFIPAAGLVVHEPGRSITVSVHDALGRLPVLDEDRTGYQREVIKH